MWEFKVKITGKENLTKLNENLKKLPAHIMQYAFERIDTVLNKLNRSIVRDIIYGGVKKRTGTLGKSWETKATKLNQYSFTVVGSFNKKIAPYVDTHVGTGEMIIFPKKSRYLWVPKKGGPTDVYPRRPVSAFYSQYVHAKPNGLRTVYSMNQFVVIPQRIDPSLIEDSLASRITGEMANISMRAFSNWKAKNGY